MKRFLLGFVFGLWMLAASWVVAVVLTGLSGFGIWAPVTALGIGIGVFFGWLNWRYPL